MSNPNDGGKSTILKDARKQKGISIEMVHEATKIPLDAIRAIEDGYSVHKMSPFYYRGFIKIYASFLDMDPTRVLQEYGMLESAAPKPRKNRPFGEEDVADEPAAPVAPKVFKKAPSDLGTETSSQQFLTSNQIKIAGLVGVVVVCLFLMVRVVGCSVSAVKSWNEKRVQASRGDARKTVKEPVKAKAKETKKPKGDTTKNKESDTPAPEKARPAAPATSEKANMIAAQAGAEASAKNDGAKSDKKISGIELTVRAVKNGWLQVKVDGKVVFQSTLKKGDAESWKADSEIELSGKNINLLEFELNGKMLGALGPSDRGAKRVVFTKDGLSVKK